MTRKRFTVYDRWKDPSRTNRPALRWYYRVWDPATQRYAGKSFAAHAEGLDWIRVCQIGRPEVPERASTLRALAQDYVSQLRRSGRCASHTQEMSAVFAALDQIGVRDWDDPDNERTISHWLTNLTGGWSGPLPKTHLHRLGKALSPLTKNRFLTHIKSLGQYALDRGLTNRNPFRSVKKITTTQPMKPTFTLDELTHLLTKTEDAWFVPFALLIYTGCRLIEGTHLRWTDLDWSGQRVYIRLEPGKKIKRQKERCIPFQRELQSILLPYKVDEGYILSDHLRTSNHTTHNKRFKDFIKSAIRTRRLSPHSSRHTWISLMVASGADLFAVAEYAGHESLTTTQGYSRGVGIYRDAVAGWGPGQFQLRPRG